MSESQSTGTEEKVTEADTTTAEEPQQPPFMTRDEVQQAIYDAEQRVKVREHMRDRQHRVAPPVGAIGTFEPEAQAPKTVGAAVVDTVAGMLASVYLTAQRAQRWVRSSVTGSFNLKFGAASFALDFAKPQLPPRTREWCIGLGPIVVPPGEVVTLQVQPQILFRSEKIVATGEIDDVYIQGAFVGQRSQLPTFQHPIALSAFKPEAVGNGMKFDTCDPALFITFQLQNLSDKPKKVAITLLGTSVMM